MNYTKTGLKPKQNAIFRLFQLAVFFQLPEIYFQPTSFIYNIIIFQPALIYFIL